MEIQIRFVFAVLKLILNFHSAASMLSLIPSINPSPNNKKLFLGLSVWDDEVLSTTKITEFLANSLS